MGFLDTSEELAFFSVFATDESLLPGLAAGKGRIRGEAELLSSSEGNQSSKVLGGLRESPLIF